MTTAIEQPNHERLSSSALLAPSDDQALKKSFAAVFKATSGKELSPAEISPLKRINEEEMYAAVTHYRLNRVSSELADKFATRLSTTIERLRQTKGVTMAFKAADRVMRAMSRAKEITHAQYKEIKYYSFGKAQFDSDRTALSTKRLPDAPSGDTAMRSVSTALRKFAANEAASQTEISIFRQREAELSRQKRRQARRLTEAVGDLDTSCNRPSRKVIPPGFIWRPHSTRDGNLVILPPVELTGKVARVTIVSPERGEVLAKGRYSGIANGGREHYRFTQRGEFFPNGSVLQLQLSTGEKREIVISKTGESLNQKRV